MPLGLNFGAVSLRCFLDGFWGLGLGGGGLGFRGLGFRGALLEKLRLQCHLAAAQIWLQLGCCLKVPKTA